MLDSMITTALGCISIALTIAATVLNGIFAIALADSTVPDVLRLLLFIAFALNVACLAYQAFFTYISIRKIHNRAVSWGSGFRWRMLAIGIVLACIAMLLTIIPLIFLVIVRDDMPHKIALRTSQTMYIVWFAVWGLSIFAEAAMFAFIAKWTTKTQRPNSVEHLDFGIHIPPMPEVRPTTSATRQSYNSQDPTLVSPPRTPRMSRTPTSSIRNSSSTRVGPGASRVKLLQKESASSLDFPASEATSIDNAFDRWDTSSVHHEIRANIHSSPPVTRSGLETIPGSRSESPANPLDGPFLPESPHAISSDAPTAIDFFPSSLPRGTTSSPPSSPPNFSRPTSRDQNRPVPNLLGSSIEDLIHVLFRPNSPRPPTIALAGTMVTAAPNAGQPLTPRTLSRMPSNTVSWKTMPSPSFSNAGSPPASPAVSQGPGSPGPSIAEEENLPPILPGFVLSAGQRSSFQGYSRRKSTKERPTSSYSKASRRSSMQI